jgi:hypothetical protein
MAPRRRTSGGVLRLFGCSAVLSFCLRGFRFRSIGDNRSTIYHLYPTHEKSVPRTEPGGADRPEAYPTGNEKSEAYSTVNENRQADVELDRLILQEG